jgi:hypothetical protein
MKKNIMAVLIDKRMDCACKVQEILTQFGCNIKTRLGLHDTDENQCSNTGLIILELIGQDDKLDELNAELDSVQGVHAKKITLEV